MASTDFFNNLKQLGRDNLIAYLQSMEGELKKFILDEFPNTQASEILKNGVPKATVELTGVNLDTLVSFHFYHITDAVGNPNFSKGITKESGSLLTIPYTDGCFQLFWSEHSESVFARSGLVTDMTAGNVPWKDLYSAVTGPKGDKGDQGDRGLPGIDGADGADGVGIIGTTKNADTSVTFEYSNSTSFTTDPLKGDTGQSAYEEWLSQGNSGTFQDFLVKVANVPGILYQTATVTSSDPTTDFPIAVTPPTIDVEVWRDNGTTREYLIPGSDYTKSKTGNNTDSLVIKSVAFDEEIIIKRYVPTSALPSSGISSVNGNTGPAVTLTADDIDDTNDINKFVNAAEKSAIASYATNDRNYQTNTQVTAAIASSVKSGDKVTTTHTPTNYTAADSTLNGNLLGIDLKLGEIKSNAQLKTFLKSAITAGDNIEITTDTNGNLVIKSLGGGPGGGTLKYTELTQSGSFTPDPTSTFVFVECIGAGGSGAVVSNNSPGAGGTGGNGGDYASKLYKVAELTSPVPVVVGTGGAARVRNTSGSSNGSNGGDSFFISTNDLKAYGGTGGRYYSQTSHKNSSVAGLAITPRTNDPLNDLTYALGIVDVKFQETTLGGRGGSLLFPYAYTQKTSTLTGDNSQTDYLTAKFLHGADSYFGGAGGGAVFNHSSYRATTSKTGVGGTSILAGNGSNGLITTSNTDAAAASAPGGGGGAILNTGSGLNVIRSGAGANGIVRMWEW